MTNQPLAMINFMRYKCVDTTVHVGVIRRICIFDEIKRSIS